jgi:hypothetical protein
MYLGLSRLALLFGLTCSENNNRSVNWDFGDDPTLLMHKFLPCIFTFIENGSSSFNRIILVVSNFTAGTLFLV